MRPPPPFPNSIFLFAAVAALLVPIKTAMSAAGEEDGSCPAAGCPAGGGGGRGWRAAVVEYGPPEFDRKETTNQYIRGILKDYERMVKEAKQNGADIIVFPEYGLAKPGLLKGATGPQDIMPFVQEVPRMPDWDMDKQFRMEVMRRLRLMARENSIYVVAGVILREKCRVQEPDCTEDVHFRYNNAAVAFDRQGNLVAKYKKHHLYADELKVFTHNDTVDVSFFDTDFGERIGLFICFDISFKEPARTLIEDKGVTTIAFPTAWVDELPSLTALQFHPGWAAANGVTLLASGRHLPAEGAMGSGVYLRDGTIASYTFQEGQNKRIIYADIGSKAENHWVKREAEKDDAEAEAKPPPSTRFLLEEDLSPYEWKKLDSNSGEIEITMGEDSSCSLEYEFSEAIGSVANRGSYALIAFRGPRKFGGGAHSLGIDACGVVFCDERLNDVIDLSKCGKRLSQDSRTSRSFEKLQLTLHHPAGEKPMPVALDCQLQPVLNSLTFTKTTPGRSQLSLAGEPAESVFSLGLYARVFSLDSK